MALNSDENFVTTEITVGTGKILLDETGVSIAGWNNYVGYKDEADYAKITLSANAKLSFSIEAADASRFVIYSLTEKKGKYTLKAVQTTTLKKAKGDVEYSATTKALSLAAGEYYISMQSTNAKKGGAAYYNVSLNADACSDLPTAVSAAQDANALSMPETSGPDVLADTVLNLTDSLSFSRLDTDVLTDASASALSELEGKSGWLNIASLA